MSKTTDQYQRISTICRDLFLKKAKDYGTSWRIMRLPSITDQLYIKAQRIRTLEETGISKVGERAEDEYIAIVNYCIIGMIQLEMGDAQDSLTLNESIADNQLPIEKITQLYDQAVMETKDLMEAKNHDYGEAWREMRVSSLIDMILTKLHRTREIDNNDGKTLVSEGIKANYQDMMNYAIFALIKMGMADGNTNN